MKIIIPIITVVISIVGSFWISTNQLINSKSSERISTLRKEFADFFASLALIVHVNKFDESVKMDYAKKAMHIVFLLDAENPQEMELRKMFQSLVLMLPKFLDRNEVKREEILKMVSEIGDQFDLIMKLENSKLKKNILYKIVPFQSK